MFSYGALEKDKFDSPARMYVGVYRKPGVDNIISDKNGHVIAYSGDILEEKYNRCIPYEVTNENGYKMFEAAVNATVDMKNYDLFFNNCDQTVTRIFATGGIHMEKHLIPNKTYRSEANKATLKRIVELLTGGENE